MKADRANLEQMEEEILAPYAMKSRDSRGRDYPEDEHPYRTAFQRDRDRVIHTTAFRRLEYKTQVFIVYEGDYYRTRLTHTIEVAQIGRTLARALRCNEDLVEAIAMAHDMGHTPFGHAGEHALNDLMSDRGGFDHNHQGLRIVQKLESRYVDFPGLNLTWEAREGMIKHASEYDMGDELDERFAAFEPARAATLEGQLINAADEIAYNTHDLDDGLRAGLIRPEELDEVELWRELRAEISEPFSEKIRHRLIRRLINKEVSDVLQTTAQRIEDFSVNSAEEVHNLRDNLVIFSAEMSRKNRELKDFLMARLYRHYRVIRMAVKARRIIEELFAAYVSCPEQLPPATQELLEHRDLHRVVCDYIAGMTDRFALEEYKKLFDPFERV